MKTPRSEENKFNELRKRAENFLSAHQNSTEEALPVDVRHLVEELHVYQIELEMQNEQLRNTQLELEAARDRYSELYDFAPTGYFTIDNKGMIREANLTGASMLGIEKGLLIGAPFSKFMNRDDSDIFYVAQRKLIETKNKQTYELDLVKKDRSQFHAHIVCIPVLDVAGNVDRIRAAVTDITERKRVEEKLKEQLTFQEALMNTLPSPVFYKDKDGNYLGCNKAFEKFFGRTREEIIGKTVYDMGPKEIADKYYEKDQELFQTLGTQSYEWEVKTKNGELREVMFDKAVFLDSNEKLAGLIGVISDLTERKRAEREKETLETKLRQVQKMEAIGTLAGGIAHDFNNILTPVIIQTELALLNVNHDSPIRDGLQEVLKASHRAKDLVRQILTFSRHTESHRVHVTVAPMVNETLKLLRSTLPTTIQIEQEIQVETGVILADPTQLHQVLMNLCTNAAYAMSEKGGILKVSLSETEISSLEVDQHPELTTGEYLKLGVSDTGCGIEPSVRERIFEPFFTTKGRAEGTGMGLSLVHGVAKSYGGAVEVDSELGKGTTFYVFFPRTQNKRPVKVEAIPKLPTGNEHVLLVDDEKIMIDSVGAMLKYLGYKVTARTSSVEALEAFRAKPKEYDLVITDMTMPNMRGDELTCQLISIRPDIPVVLCTGFSEMISEEKAEAIGVREFVMKPIIMKDMANTIRKVLDED